MVGTSIGSFTRSVFLACGPVGTGRLPFQSPRPRHWRTRLSSCLKRAAFLRQLRLSIRPVPEEYSPASRIELLTRRSEEHTSELQSRENLVCRLLLEKKNDNL